MRRWAMGVDESFHTTSGARRTAQTPRGAQIPAGLPYAGHAASTPDYSAKGYCIILGVSHVKMSETQEVVAVEPVEPARSLLRNTSKSTTHIPGVSLKTCIVLNNNCSLLLEHVLNSQNMGAPHGTRRTKPTSCENIQLPRRAPRGGRRTACAGSCERALRLVH
ncbi:hypothetical protein J6590_107603 [Homalodisca vitripennis]|nr:hypothetical protein J6590_107603 [Homalodisca vitripennis]